MIVFTSTDHVQHVFWNLPGGIEYIERTYEAVDQQLGRFIEALPEEATLIVMSDHGAGRINKIVYLDNWLAQEGYFFKVPFSLKRTGLRMLKAILQRNIPTHLRKSLRHRFPMLKNRLEATLQDGHVDWNHTKAYAFGMYGNVCINLKGREPFGIVAPEDYPYLLGEIADKLMALSDPDTGLPIVQKVYRKEELYSGSYTNRAPDLIIQWRDYAYFTKKGIDKGNRIFDDSLMIDASKYPHTGTHRTNGMFVAKGPNVKRSTQINADIIDLAPTILHMMGIAPPDILDGRILSGMFNNHRLQNYPAHPQSQQIDIPVDLKQTVGFSDTEEESIRQRLKSLGYI